MNLETVLSPLPDDAELEARRELFEAVVGDDPGRAEVAARTLLARYGCRCLAWGRKPARVVL